jgi:hypothetical protein
MDVTNSIQKQLRQEIATQRASNGGIEPAWLTVPMAVRYASVSRSKIYQFVEDGRVKSVCLRDRDKIRGTRLISRASLESYLSKFENLKSEPVPGAKRRKRRAGGSL